MASHILKYKYGMNPLTITWPPMLYTEYGYKNFRNWIEIGGFDNLTYNQNGRVMKSLTKLSIQNLLHPFQTFILGQKHLAPKIAKKFNIPLIFYGESEAEYGSPIAEHSSSLRENEYYTYKNIKDLYIAGLSIGHLEEKFGLTLKDLSIFLPIEKEALEDFNLEFHSLGYYIKWIPQEAYYYAVENSSFKARPFRTQGTYSKYNSIDDKIDDLQFYTLFVKFGIGRATYDVAQELRNDHLSIEEGKKLIKKYEGEFPNRYFTEIMKYLNINKNYFHKLCNKFRSPHLWKKMKNRWHLRHTANRDGIDD